MLAALTFTINIAVIWAILKFVGLVVAATTVGIIAKKMFGIFHGTNDSLSSVRDDIWNNKTLMEQIQRQLSDVFQHQSKVASKIIRVEDLAENTMFVKEDSVLVKQTGGYCLSLENLCRFQVRPKERVDHVFTGKFRGFWDEENKVVRRFEQLEAELNIGKYCKRSLTQFT